MLTAADATLSWGAIVFAAAVTGVAAALGLLLAVRPRQRTRVVVGAVAALAAPLAWFALVRVVGAPGWTTRVDLALFPVHWAAVGAGVWTFAAVAAALGFGPERRATASRVVTLALGCAIAAIGVGVYLT